MNHWDIDYLNATMRVEEFHREAERAALLRLALRTNPPTPPAWKRFSAHLAGHVMSAAGRRLVEAGERLHGQIHAHDPQPCPGETA